MRPGMVRTFSAWLGESVTEDHPGGEFFPRRYAAVREKAASTPRAEFGDQLPNGHTPEELAPLLIAVLDGMRFQWLLDPDNIDMSAAFRTMISLLRKANQD